MEYNPEYDTQLRIDSPNEVESYSCDPSMSEFGPDLVDDLQHVEFWVVSLEEAIQIALKTSKVMRDLGGNVLRSPGAITTIHDPAIAFTDPRFGEEAALSHFDATLSASAFFDKNDRIVNNRFLGNNGFIQQDFGDYRLEMRKRSATGTTMSLRQTAEYDFNNSIGNRFGIPESGSWATLVDAEVRHPFLRGGGILFNRIAGPSDQPGVINGVLVSRIRTDISLADFEIGIRNLVSNVENAYWDLYFAYRDLDAKIKARDRALDAWRFVQNKAANKDFGGERDKEGQVREQYWRFQAEVIDALSGRLLDGTSNQNGSSGGTFRGQGGLRLAERRLRLAMGVPINDGRLLQPTDEPAAAPIAFDWQTAARDSLDARPELRKQRWLVKQVELELRANRNFLLPQLDAIARYRWRGFGSALISESEQEFRSSVDDLLGGNNQEWQMGVEFSLPIGFRQAHAAVRNSELRLRRETAILDEQQRHILFGLSNGVSDVKRAFLILQAQYNRLDAAKDQVEAVSLSYKNGLAPLDLVLEAQRRLVETEIAYHRSRIEYALALKNVHFEKGTLLEYCKISLAESLSTPDVSTELSELYRNSTTPTCRDAVITAGR